ncbi:MAG TPA: hypothetical protein VN611_03565 [Patescibacteria group bacterium]|nr:hypothetical protein [Patescibacteria group bacterium]
MNFSDLENDNTSFLICSAYFYLLEEKHQFSPDFYCTLLAINFPCNVFSRYVFFSLCFSGITVVHLTPVFPPFMPFIRKDHNKIPTFGRNKEKSSEIYPYHPEFISLLPKPYLIFSVLFVLA